MYVVVQVLLTLMVFDKNGVTLGQPDPSVCTQPVKGSPIQPLPFPAVYSAVVESKLLLERRTVNIKEVRSKRHQRALLTVTDIAETSKYLFDYNHSQILILKKYKPHLTSCLVKNMTESSPLSTLYRWLTPLHSLLKGRGDSFWTPLSDVIVRNMTAHRYQRCQYDVDRNMTIKIDAYFSVNTWLLPSLKVALPSLLRIDMYGHEWNQTHLSSQFNVVNDYVEFTIGSEPAIEELQTPPFALCYGRKGDRAFPKIPQRYFMQMETVDEEFKLITHVRVWFDHERKMVKYESSKANNSNSPAVLTTVYDYRAGVKYSNDRFRGTCSQMALQSADIFVSLDRQGQIKMANGSWIFHSDNVFAMQYVGKRLSRGVLCDVWLGLYYDTYLKDMVTVEWYFTDPSWKVTTAGGVADGAATIFRMDIWKPDESEVKVHHIDQFDASEILWREFDVTGCYPFTKRIRFAVDFFVAGNGRTLSDTNQNALIEKIRLHLAEMAEIGTERFTRSQVDYDGGKHLVFTATLLDLPSSRSKLVPISDEHSLLAAYSFLEGNLISTWLWFAINSSQVVQLQALKVQPVTYSFDSPTTSSTKTTAVEVTDSRSFHPSSRSSTRSDRSSSGSRGPTDGGLPSPVSRTELTAATRASGGVKTSLVRNGLSASTFGCSPSPKTSESSPVCNCSCPTRDGQPMTTSAPGQITRKSSRPDIRINGARTSERHGFSTGVLIGTIVGSLLMGLILGVAMSHCYSLARRRRRTASGYLLYLR